MRQMSEQSFKNMSGHIISISHCLSEVQKLKIIRGPLWSGHLSALTFYYYPLPGSFCLIIPEQIRNAFPSGFLHLLLPLPEMSFPRIYIRYNIYFPLALCTNVIFLNKAFPDCPVHTATHSHPWTSYVLSRSYPFASTALNHHLIILPIY